MFKKRSNLNDLFMCEERYSELGKEVRNPYGEVSSTTSFMYFDPLECSALDSILAGEAASVEPRPDLETMDMESFKRVLLGNDVLREMVTVKGNLIIDFVSHVQAIFSNSF